MDKKLKKKLEPYLNTRNFFVYKDFYKIIAQNQNIHKVAEIGSWKGHSISFLVNHMIKAGKEDFEVYAVDIWEQAEWPSADEEFRNFELKHIYDIYNINLEKYGTRKNIKDIKMASFAAADKFDDGYFDFVYLDGDHRKEGVTKDIMAWKSKVKKGGILAGHDYYDRGNNLVKSVVDNFVNEGFLPPIKEHAGHVWWTTIED